MNRSEEETRTLVIIDRINSVNQTCSRCRTTSPKMHVCPNAFICIAAFFAAAGQMRPTKQKKTNWQWTDIFKSKFILSSYICYQFKVGRLFVVLAAPSHFHIIVGVTIVFPSQFSQVLLIIPLLGCAYVIRLLLINRLQGIRCVNNTIEWTVLSFKA